MLIFCVCISILKQLKRILLTLLFEVYINGRMLSYMLLYPVDFYVVTNISEESTASIFRLGEKIPYDIYDAGGMDQEYPNRETGNEHYFLL